MTNNSGTHRAAASMRKTAGMRPALVSVAALHATAAVLLACSAGEHGAQALGLAAVAYLAGVKHSYDWDHIAAIDNSSRRFAARGQQSATVGLAFSLGHCSVVTCAAALVVGGAGFIGEAFNEGSTVSVALGAVGSGVSGLFLLALGAFNLIAFRATAAAASRLRSGEELSQSDLEPRGLAARLVTGPLKSIREPRDLYAVGFLFGLGFDTATTIGLLVTTATAVLAGIPPFALLALPFAFSASMTLFDTLNGIAMMRLYSQALSDPSRRLVFNLVVTGMSALSALFVAVLTLAGLTRQTLSLQDPLTAFLANIDLGQAGLLLVGSFGAVWTISTFAERAKRRKTCR